MFYQAISFIIVVILLESILQVLIKVTGVIEKILKFTIVLGIPSKILGFLVGLIEGFVFVFLALFLLNQPSLKIDIVNDSKLTSKILNSTPILSNIAGGMVDTIEDINELVKDYNDDKVDPNSLDLESIDIMLEHKVISTSYVRKLIDNKKIEVVGIESILNKYE